MSSAQLARQLGRYNILSVRAFSQELHQVGSDAVEPLIAVIESERPNQRRKRILLFAFYAVLCCFWFVPIATERYSHLGKIVLLMISMVGFGVFILGICYLGMLTQHLSVPTLVQKNAILCLIGLSEYVVAPILVGILLEAYGNWFASERVRYRLMLILNRILSSPQPTDQIKLTLVQERTLNNILNFFSSPRGIVYLNRNEEAYEIFIIALLKLKIAVDGPNALPILEKFAHQKAVSKSQERVQQEASHYLQISKDVSF